VGTIDVEDGQLRRVGVDVQVLIATLKEPQVTVGDLAVEDELSLDGAADEPGEVGVGDRGEGEALFNHPARHVRKHEVIDLRGRCRRNAQRAIGRQAAAGFGEGCGGNEFPERFDGITVP
jgi:hypothetical protein